MLTSLTAKLYVEYVLWLFMSDCTVDMCISAIAELNQLLSLENNT